MELTLKNIGIIKDSTIKLDGLTVITGPNNSGKSTVGKALYSLIKAETLPDSEYQNEINITKSNSFIKIVNELRLDIISKFIKAPIMDQVGGLINLFILFGSLNKLRQIAFDYDMPNNIANDLYKNYDLLPKFFEVFDKKYLAEISISKASTDSNYQEYLQGFDKRMNKAKKEYEKTNKLITADDNFQLFLRNSLSRILKTEFSMQVISNIFGEQNGNLLLKEDNRVIDFVKVFKNGDVEPDSFEFNKSNFSNVILFDDAYSVDGLNRHQNNVDRYSHNMHLLNCLQNKKDETIFEEELSKIDINHILDIINKSYPGEISKINDVYIYEDKVIKSLFVQNLATGSKCFATIKQLINNRQLNKNSLLILDEPESHLHPEWQNIFAEIIVLLVKEWGVKVLLTTHSPNFLMALENFSNKMSIEGRTSFYHVRRLEDGYTVHYDYINDRLSEAYSSFAKPLIDLQKKD